MIRLGGYLRQLTRLKRERRLLVELVTHLDQLVGAKDSDDIDDIDEYIFSTEESKLHPLETVEDVRGLLAARIAEIDTVIKRITEQPVGEPSKGPKKGRPKKGEKQ